MVFLKMADKKINLLQALPQDTLRLIFGYLTFPELMRLRATSKEISQNILEWSPVAHMVHSLLTR
jgi:hypothetical protein